MKEKITVDNMMAWFEYCKSLWSKNTATNEDPAIPTKSIFQHNLCNCLSALVNACANVDVNNWSENPKHVKWNTSGSTSL